jgi:hypothetical protein
MDMANRDELDRCSRDAGCGSDYERGGRAPANATNIALAQANVGSRLNMWSGTSDTSDVCTEEMLVA